MSILNFWKLAISAALLGLAAAQQATGRSPLCRDGLNTLSIKDMPILDVASWDRLKKTHDILVVGVSDSTCADACCQTEGILQDFQGYGLKQKGKTIPVVRIDISKIGSNAVLEKEDIRFDSVPRIVIYKEKSFYSYDGAFDRVDMLVHHINRLINPLVVLNSEEDVERFLGLHSYSDDGLLDFWEADYNTTFLRQLRSSGRVVPDMDTHWRQQRLQTRVICFLYDKQEYKEELQNLRRDARFLATRDNLRIGLLTDNQRLIRKLKAGKYGPRLFPVGTNSMSALTLRRYDGTLRVHDITGGDDHVAIHHWINKQTLKEVEELHPESYRIQELIRQPMFLTFVDFVDPRYAKESYRAVEVIREIAPKYSHLIGFFYVNNTMFWQRKRVLGVTWDELPSMAFNMLGDASKIMPYPRGREISKNALFDFLDDLFTGRSGHGESAKQEYQTPTNFSKVRNDTEIESVILNSTIIATRSNFGELVFTEGYEVLVLLITTEIVHQGQRGVALQFNLVADAFNKLRAAYPKAEQKFANVRVVAYDVNVNAFPEGIEFTLDLPQILFFPAYDKRQPYRRFTGQAAIAGPVMLWMQQHASTKFEYPVDVSRVGYPREQEAAQKKEEQAETQVVEETSVGNSNEDDKHNEDL